MIAAAVPVTTSFLATPIVTVAAKKREPSPTASLTSVLVPVALKTFALKASDMAQRVIVVDSPYKPQEKAELIFNALRERYVDLAQGFAIRENGDDCWIVEFDGEINGLDLRIIREYAEGFCDGILALRG